MREFGLRNIAGTGRLAVTLFLVAHPSLGQTDAVTASLAMPNDESSAKAAPREPGSERPRVLLEVSTETRDLLPLLRAELEDLNLQVIESDNSSAAGSQNSEDLQRTSSIPFRVVVTQKSVEVWIYDPASSRITLREVFNKVDGSPLEARTTVLHAVELLRWSLSEHDPARASQSRAATRSISPVRPARQSRWSVDGNALLTLSPGGTRAGLGASVGVAWHEKQFGARAVAGSLFVPNRLTLSEGQMEATPIWLGLEGALFSEASQSPLKYQVGAGLALLNVRLRGVSNSNLDAHSDSYLTAAPMLDLRAYGKVSDVLAFGFTGTGMAPLKSDVLRLDNGEVGRFGKLVVAVGVGLELSL